MNVTCHFQWLPESPRFDIARGMPDRAMATLQRVARDNGKPMPLGKLVDLVSEVDLFYAALKCEIHLVFLDQQLISYPFASPAVRHWGPHRLPTV